MKTLGNLIWLIFGGIITAIEYFVASIPFFISIIGIPFGLQILKLGKLTLWPFGAQIVIKPGNPGCLSTIMNMIWFFIGGILIALTHLFFGIILGITIIGIPFAIQHFKLLLLALTPFGRDVVWN